MAPATLRLIDRDDLLAALDRAAARKVTIISAPAGSGKTSLIGAWADRPGGPHRLAVVPVQRDQHDAQLFWLALLDAVRRATGAAGGAEPAAATPEFNARTMVDRVLSALGDARGDLTLVLEDLHELASPAAFGQLTRLLTNLPPGVHAIVSTRHDLRLRLHRLRLAGELSEIRASDLRFSARETRKLLDAAGIALSQAGAAVLHQRTEGWAAGLRLAVISLAGHPDPERFVAEFSGSERTVAEYLLAEMLDRQRGDVQRLLLRTCLLDRVNGELADLLTGRPGSERVLLDLEDANAFFVSLNPERTWFRYHHLFADLLRLELRHGMPKQVPELHRRAAGWFIEHGEVVDAIRHTQAAGDWPGAARLLADHSFSLTLDGQTQTLQALVRAFPPGADHPELALVRAMGDLGQGHLDEAAAHLAVAETYAETAPPDRRRRLRVAIAALQLSLARRRGHLAGVIEQAGFLDSPLAYELSADPVELRLRNHADADPRSGAAWSSKSLKQCYEAAGQAIGWADRDPRPASMRKDGLLLGYGMSSAAYPVGQRELTQARIRVCSDHSAMVQCGAQDLGTGTYTIAAQITADELALGLERVTVMLGDTDFPRAGNSTGATTSASVGNAVQLAARSLRQQIIHLAVTDPHSPLAGQAEDSITVDNGCLRSASLAQTDTYGEVLLRRALTTLDGFSQWDPASGTGISGGKTARIVRADTSSWAFGAWFAVVTVDPDLGLVRVERMAGAWAAGRILNRKTAENQMRGGAIMGIGQALLEGSATDPATARLLNPGLNEYLIPTHADAPPIDVTFIEEHDPYVSPLGSKGIGELPVVGAAPAIANAVFHATRRRIRRLPIMPEDLM